MRAFFGVGPFAMAAAILLAAGLAAQQARAQAPLELFDAHMHYNQEPNPFYPLDKILEIFKRNNVTACSPPAGPTRAPIN